MSKGAELIEEYRNAIAKMPDRHLVEGYRTAYLEMVKNTGFRPGALDRDMDPAELLEIEACQYAIEFFKEDDSGHFYIGRSDSLSNRALFWAIQGAHICCGGDKRIAITLFKMAADELEKKYDSEGRARPQPWEV